MPKLKVNIIHKCPKCGKQMRITRYQYQGKQYHFYYCPDPKCRHAEEKQIEPT